MLIVIVIMPAVLYAGSIASNITLGQNNISGERLNTAAKISQNAEFIGKKKGALMRRTVSKYS